MTDVDLDPNDIPEVVEFDCPRCRHTVTEAFYGPCVRCRRELRATQGTDGRDIETVAYEPKMNVVPNQIATKE